MNQMNNGRPDLNLLVIFDAVWKHRKVTTAARSLALSQPAVSHALNRLRGLVGDPLFIRVHNGLAPTRRAEGMAVQVSAILELARSAFGQETFDAGHSHRRFHVGVTEYATQAALPALVAHLHAQAPNAGVETSAIGADTLTNLASGTLDCAFWGASPPEPPFQSIKLYREHFLGYVCRNHPLAADGRDTKVSLDDFLSYPHAIVRLAKTGASPLDTALEKIGRKRHIALGAPSFAEILAALPGSNMIFSVPSRYASAARDRQIVGLSLPPEVPGFDYSLIWHERLAADPAFVWFRQLVVRAIGDTPPDDHGITPQVQ